jgi:PAS domain S-box-containing protein
MGNVHPEDRDRVYRSLKAFIADGQESWQAEYRFRCADGSYKNAYDRGFLLRGRERAPIRLIGAMMDITALMRTEAELRRFRMLVEQSNDFIAMSDLEGRCLFLNAGGRRLAGVEETADLGNILDFVFEADRGKARRVWRAAAREGQWIGELNLRHRLTGKAIPVMWNIFPVREPGNGPFAMAAVGRDMTLLQEQEEQLRQGQKMEAIGKLAGGIAHDFNNILTVINGYGELLRGGLAPDDPNRHLLDAMLDSGRRAASLTAQLLAYGRKQVLQPRVLDLNEVVEGTAVMLRRLIGEHIELRLSLDRSLPKVKADPAQIDQILVNLCLNARDAIGKGGVLLIETGWARLGGGLRGRFGDLVPGTYATLTVVDNGQGMPEDVVEHIFEPFFTTKETGEGPGLGLSSAYGIIRQSGGGIEVRSRPGEGSTFRVYLPSLPQPEDAQHGPEGAAGGTGASTGRVLLVEDEAHVRTITRNLLEHGGYQVWETRDGVEALALYDRMYPAPDLVLTDALMPRMGGRMLAEEVRKRRPDQKILFMSGYSEEALPEPDTSQPGFRILLKPFTSQTLYLAVQEALHTEPVPEGGVTRAPEGEAGSP